MFMRALLNIILTSILLAQGKNIEKKKFELYNHNFFCRQDFKMIAALPVGHRMVT